MSQAAQVSDGALTLLVLGSTVSPGELVRVATMMAPDPARAVALRRYGLPVIYAALAALALSLTPQAVRWRHPSPAWLALALVAALVTQAGEIAVGYGWLRARGVAVAGIALHRSWDDTRPALLLTTGLVGAAEELIFRGVWLELLVDTHHWPVLGALAVCTLVYGANHWWFGSLTVAQKTLAGAVYGGLYLGSGGVVAVPLVAHVAQNALAVSLGGRRRPTASGGPAAPARSDGVAR